MKKLAYKLKALGKGVEKRLKYKITALGIGSWGERGMAMGIE